MPAPPKRSAVRKYGCVAAAKQVLARENTEPYGIVMRRGRQRFLRYGAALTESNRHVPASPRPSVTASAVAAAVAATLG